MRRRHTSASRREPADVPELGAHDAKRATTTASQSRESLGARLLGKLLRTACLVSIVLVVLVVVVASLEVFVTAPEKTRGEEAGGHYWQRDPITFNRRVGKEISRPIPGVRRVAAEYVRDAMPFESRTLGELAATPEPTMQPTEAEIFAGSEAVVHFTSMEDFDEAVQIGDDSMMPNGETRRFWLVDFYATWCPHCRDFAPTYEKLAKRFRDAGAAISLGAVACDEGGQELCKRQGIDRYPRVFAFHVPPLANASVLEALLAEREDANATVANATVATEETEWQPWKHTVRVVEHTEEGLAQWIEDRFAGEPFPRENLDVPVLEKRRVEKERKAAEEAERLERMGPPKILRPSEERFVTDERIATFARFLSIAFERDVFTGKDVLSRGADQALRDWVDVLYRYFPGLENRMALGRLLTHLRDAKAAAESRLRQGAWSTILRKQWDQSVSVFDTKYTQKVRGWQVCKGSNMKTRGYTCALWVGFHLLVANAGPDGPEGNGANAADVALAIRSFVEHFFGCEVCRFHFLKHNPEPQLQALRGPTPEASHANVSLWLWEVHNVVNLRLADEELEADSAAGDPVWPKELWPLERDCAFCRLGAGTVPEERRAFAEKSGVQWDYDLVLDFLQRTYQIPEDASFQAYERDRRSLELHFRAFRRRPLSAMLALASPERLARATRFFLSLTRPLPSEVLLCFGPLLLIPLLLLLLAMRRKKHKAG